MRKFFILLIVLLITMLPLNVITAQDLDCHGILVLNGYARPTVTPTGAVYGLLVNLGDEDITLMGGSTDVAEVVEVHSMMMGEDDVMMMEPLPDGLTIPARGFVTLEPGGYHMMAIGLTTALAEGDTFHLTMNFSNGDSLPMALPVMEPAEEMPGEMMQQGVAAGIDATSCALDIAPIGTPSIDLSAGASSEDMEMSMGDCASAPATTDVMSVCPGLHVLGAWARSSVTENSAAYALILNLTDTDDVLLGGRSSLADVVEIHTMRMGEDDVMMMEPLPNGLTIPAGGYALLKPGSFHVMMIGLTDTLEAGSMVDITLNFAVAGEVRLSIPVQDPNAMPMSEDMNAMPEGMNH